MAKKTYHAEHIHFLIDIKEYIPQVADAEFCHRRSGGGWITLSMHTNWLPLAQSRLCGVAVVQQRHYIVPDEVERMNNPGFEPQARIYLLLKR